jgi:hypothetical protein
MKLTRETKHQVKVGDRIRFRNGDTYIVDTVIEYPRSLAFTLRDVKDGGRIYAYPSSECYGAEIERD